jgi:hypothetical protein
MEPTPRKNTRDPVRAGARAGATVRAASTGGTPVRDGSPPGRTAYGRPAAAKRIQFTIQAPAGRLTHRVLRDLEAVRRPGY